MKKILLIALIICSLDSFAQDDPQKIVDKFFGMYTTKSPSEAIDYVFSTNKWMSDSQDQIDNVKFKLNSTLKQLGNYTDYSLISKKSIGDHLALYTFIVKYDRQPLRFSLLFYKPEGSWRVQNFSYDDSLDDELEEAAKAYRLQENRN